MIEVGKDGVGFPRLEVENTHSLAVQCRHEARCAVSYILPAELRMNINMCTGSVTILRNTFRDVTKNRNLSCGHSVGM